MRATFAGRLLGGLFGVGLLDRGGHGSLLHWLLISSISIDIVEIFACDDQTL
jgi:hypothetical protein